MKATKLVLLAAFALGLSSCRDIEIENGEIPEAYVDAARAYMGEYEGRFDGRRGALSLALQDRYVELSFRGVLSGDLLPGCQARVGDLKVVNGSEKDGKVTLRRAVFEFDPGACWARIAGRQIFVEFFRRSGREFVDVSLLQENRAETICTVDPGDPSRGIPPTPICRTEMRPVYLTGRFSR